MNIKYNKKYKYNIGISIIETNNKWNIILKNNNLFSTVWFDNIIYIPWKFKNFLDYYCVVQLNNKYNIIDLVSNQFLTDKWFDDFKYNSHLVSNDIEGFYINYNANEYMLDKYGNIRHRLKSDMGNFNFKYKI